MKQITLLGTLKKNKPEIPKQFATGKNQEVVSSLFGFRNRQTLVSYVHKKKIRGLAFNVHSDKEVDEATGKPLMILDYNTIKAAVDRVDQLCHNYSVQKRRKRWPLPYFYNCLNIAVINALVIYQAKFPNWASGKSH